MPKKKLVIACDGTWNSPEQRKNDVAAPTNVVRLYNCIAKRDADGIEQRRYYHSGVGTDGNLVQRVAGGAFGRGISTNIMATYAWLAQQYQPGDEIWLFGFSRGAFSVRSLAGMIGCCGLPVVNNSSASQVWELTQQAFTKIYRVEPHMRPQPSWPGHPVDPATGKTPIRFIGVWDTVGALGVPDDLGVLDMFDDPTRWKFHDAQLGAGVAYARHALAIDELRSSFTPTLWTAKNPEPGKPDRVLNDVDEPGKPARVKQLWFPGAHSDVGGGYGECELSDGALKWMVDEATGIGLTFDPAMVEQIRPSPRGLLHDSNEGGFKLFESRPRNRPPLSEQSCHYHPSAWQRDKAPPITQCPYHHPTQLLKVGETAEDIEVQARNQWNETGIFLEAGAVYEFRANGEWVDKDLPCGPDGKRAGKFRIGDAVHAVLSGVGAIETAANKAFNTPGVDLPATRRNEDMPWFCLVGVIANDDARQVANPDGDGSAPPHQMFRIGAGCRIAMPDEPARAGYLYCYANDAWHFYDNNHGSVTLSITRIS